MPCRIVVTLGSCTSHRFSSGALQTISHAYSCDWDTLTCGVAPLIYREPKPRPNMRNLRATRRGAWEHPGPIAAVCWDPASDEVICAVGPSSESSSIELFRVDDKGTEM